MINEALYALGIDGGWKIKDGKIAKWYSEQPQPTEAEIQAKIVELQAAEPMRLLRLERTRKLAESDWMANSDVTMTEEWRLYRQALRDITTQTPLLDENGQLTGINWPTPPND